MVGVVSLLRSVILDAQDAGGIPANRLLLGSADVLGRDPAPQLLARAVAVHGRCIGSRGLLHRIKGFRVQAHVGHPAEHRVGHRGSDPVPVSIFLNLRGLVVRGGSAGDAVSVLILLFHLVRRLALAPLGRLSRLGRGIVVGHGTVAVPLLGHLHRIVVAVVLLCLAGFDIRPAADSVKLHGRQRQIIVHLIRLGAVRGGQCRVLQPESSHIPRIQKLVSAVALPVIGPTVRVVAGPLGIYLAVAVSGPSVGIGTGGIIGHV